MRQLQTRYGPLVVPGQDADLIGRFLTRFGEWAWLEVTIVSRLLAPGGRVLDGGAFAGTFGLGLSLLRHLRSICFVEANPLSHAALAQNTARCCWVGHTVISGLLAPRMSPLSSGWSEPNNLGSCSYAEGPVAAEKDEQVTPEQIVALEELSSRFGPFDLIKLDIEGLELPLLRAELAFIQEADAGLWLECKADSGSLELCALLLGLDRELWYFAFPAFNPDNYNGETESLFPFAYESCLFLAPRGAEHIAAIRLPPRCVRRRITCLAALKEALWLTPRFAPPGWEVLDRQEIAALASHEMAGETYSGFLSEAAGNTWLSPLARLTQQVALLERELASVRAGV